MSRVVLVVALALVAGCGGGEGPLAPAGGFEPPAGAVSTGQGRMPDRAGMFPAYQVEGAREGTPLRYRVRVRNGGSEPVTVTGVEDDPDVDGQFVSRRLAGPVRLGAGATATVEVIGRLGRCAERAAGQLTTKYAQRLRYHTGEDDQVQLVDLDAILEIESPDDAGCPSR